MKTLLKGLIVIALLTLFNACGSSDSGSSTPLESGAKVTSNAEDLALLEKSIILENQAYSALILEFTDNGKYPPFDPNIEMNSSNLAYIGDLTKQLSEAYKGYDLFYASMAKKYPETLALQTSAYIQSTPAKSPGIFARLIKGVTGYDMGREKMRTFISKVLSAQSPKLQKETFGSIKTWAHQGNRNINVGSDYSLFIVKLRSGALDDVVYRIHNELYNSGGQNDGEADYLAKTIKFGASPNKLAWTIGVEAVNKAVEFEIKASALIAGPLGVVVETTMGNIATANDFAKDPTGTLTKIFTDKAKSVISTNISNRLNKTLDYKNFNEYVGGKISDTTVDTAVKNIQNYSKNVEINRKLKAHNYNIAKVREEMKSESDNGTTSWNIGELVSSVTDEAKNSGSMLISWYNENEDKFLHFYNNNIQSDEAVTLLSTDHNYTISVFDDKNETKPTKYVEHKNVQISTDKVTVTTVDVIAQDVAKELKIKYIYNGKESDFVGFSDFSINDELTIKVIIPHEFYPPYQLQCAGGNMANATFVLTANLTSRESSFAEFSASQIGSYWCQLYVTDKNDRVTDKAVYIDVTDNSSNVSGNTYIGHSNFIDDEGTTWDTDIGMYFMNTGVLDGAVRGTLSDGFDSGNVDGTISGNWSNNTFTAQMDYTICDDQGNCFPPDTLTYEGEYTSQSTTTVKIILRDENGNLIDEFIATKQ